MLLRERGPVLNTTDVTLYFFICIMINGLYSILPFWQLKAPENGLSFTHSTPMGANAAMKSAAYSIGGNLGLSVVLHKYLTTD